MAFVFTDDNAAQEIQSGKPVVIDFWATWCVPCKRLAPVIEELAAEYEGRILIGKYNVEDGNDLTTEFGIRNIPTLLFFKDGKQVGGRMVGAQPKAEIEARLKELL